MHRVAPAASPCSPLWMVRRKIHYQCASTSWPQELALGFFRSCFPQRQRNKLVSVKPLVLLVGDHTWHMHPDSSHGPVSLVSLWPLLWPTVPTSASGTETHTNTEQSVLPQDNSQKWSLVSAICHTLPGNNPWVLWASPICHGALLCHGDEPWIT